MKTAHCLVVLHNIRGDPSFSAPDDAQFDIDTDVDTVFAHVASHSLNTCIPTPQGYELSADGRELWQSFAESDKAIILHALGQAPTHTTGSAPTHATASNHPSSLYSSPPSNAATNCQLSSCLADLLFQDGNNDQVPSAEEATASPDMSGNFSDDPFLAHVTQQKPSKRTWTQPLVADLPPQISAKFLLWKTCILLCKQIPKHCRSLFLPGRLIAPSVWHISTPCLHHIAPQFLACLLIVVLMAVLLVMMYIQVTEKMLCTVDICGINNHEVKDIPVITVGGVVKTQHGLVIIIMPQYAYLGKGKLIHSFS